MPRFAALASASVSTDHFRLRTANASDLEEIVEVCSVALGWSNPQFDRQLFEWKHLQNPFGESLLVVAEDDTGIAAVRPLMRWRFRTRSGLLIDAARAVDTATHPRAQGKGLFTRLTTMALDQLSAPDAPGAHDAPGADFIFNTPNEASLAGYLKMGWIERGRIGFGFSVRSPIGVAKLARSRTRANKQSIAIPNVGISVEEGLSLLDQDNPCSNTANSGDSSRELSEQLHTDHSIESLRWRYADSPIEYRFLPGPDASGIIVRLRERGASRELLVAQRCGSIGNEAAGKVVRNAMRNAKADFCIGWAGLGSTLTTERPGPTLALRLLGNSVGRQPQFDWQPGDIELF